MRKMIENTGFELYSRLNNVLWIRTVTFRIMWKKH